MEMLQDPVSVFSSYCAVKAHFNTEYDIVKYRGKLALTRTALTKRKDRILFETLAKMLTKKDNVPFFVSQFVENMNMHVSDIVLKPQKARTVFESWKERIEKYPDNLKRDLRELEQFIWELDLKETDTFNTSSNGDYPVLFKMYSLKKITPESYALLDDVFHHLDNEIEDAMVQSINFKMKKYRLLLSMNKNKITRIINSVYNTDSLG